jgi:hypothetical protein
MQRQPEPQNHAPQGSIEDLQDRALNIAYNVASILTMPLEMMLRPWYGSLYFSPVNQFFTAIFLSVATAFTTTAQVVGQMIPFARIRGPVGIYGLGSFSELFFLMALVHGVRIWRRMLHPETEDIAVFEGPALPVFAWFPKGERFWTVRILYEPALVFATSTLLSTLLIIQWPLTLYLHVAALCLAMKQYVAWFRNWQFMRRMIDMSNIAPIIARVVKNTASNEDLARVHMATLPKDLSPEIQRATVAHLTRAYGVTEGE